MTKTHGAQVWVPILATVLLTVATATSPASAESVKKQQASSGKRIALVEGDKSNLRPFAAHHSTATVERQQELLSRLSSKPESTQAIADKKQGDQAKDSAASFGPADEYVNIKPEEVNEGSSLAKDMDDSVALASEPQAQVQPAPVAGVVAEHKSSADDELSAHLAKSDALSQLESSQRPYAASTRVAHYAGPMVMRGPPAQLYGGGHPMVRAPPRRPLRGPPQPGARQPPSYFTLKGKLTGINSLISQYPHPAPGYPHHVPRHLPRGAAAGYAAFRDFVRAHASKYKQASPSLEGPKEYQQAGREPAATSALYQMGGPQQAFSYQSNNNYHQHQSNKAAATGNYNRHQGTKTTKVTVAQAYIPHLAAAPAAGAADYQTGGQSTAGSAYGAANPMLAKLYGGHAPQGVGRPEYNKDYGMVIHYPQATVYTEPMTVDQLHKLTGAGISQVLAQLQHNLANGHRDESNTIRSNNHHHIGHGLTIHAKEYYAPDKGGRYVPTTAAVITTNGNKPESGSYGGDAGASQESYGPSQVQMGPSLGAGYERVKQAAAASQEKHSGGSRQVAQAGDYSQAKSQQYQAAPAISQAYDSAAASAAAPSAKYNGEPLSSVTNFLGSELDALYKANAAFTKQLEPELQAQLAAYAKSLPKTPLRYTELDQHRPTLALEALAKGPRGYGVGQQHGGNKYGGPRIRMPRRHPGRGLRHSNRYQPQHHQQYVQQHAQGYGQQQSYGPQQARPRPQQAIQHGANNYQQQQQQLHSYQVAEQALNQQMAELLRDFHSGDDQYNGKNHQVRTINQGYPHKVMQKQQSNSYGQQHSMYSQHEGLEIPQGANDQIGEIAELIEVLKGTLEAHTPDSPAQGAYSQKQSANNLEDVRYLASALGQAPSYAAQVPVAGGEDASKKGAAYQESYQQQAQQQYGYQQAADQQQQQQQPQPQLYNQEKAQEQTGAGYQPQAAADNYAQQPQAAGYEAQVAGYAQQSATGSYDQQQPQAPTAANYITSVQHVVTPLQTTQAQYGQQAAVAPIAAQAASGAYTQQAEQQQTGAGYQQEQHHQQAATGDYQQQQSGTGSGYQQQTSGGGSGYQQQQPATSANYQQQQQPSNSAAGYQQTVSGYSNTEHTQLINHLVPVSQQQQQPAAAQAGDYAEAPAVSHQQQAQQQQQQQQQPAHQIAVAAPTEAQYQQAQSLSSFVDSLPTDYQELLRQPALDGSSAGTAHLAALGQEASAASGYSSYNATSAATVPTTSGHEAQQTYLQQASGETQSQQQQQQSQQTAQYSASR